MFDWKRILAGQSIVHSKRTAFENRGIKWKCTLLFFEEIETKISGILRISHFFTELAGRPNLVNFKDMALSLLNKLREMKKQTPIHIVTTAVKIIKSDLRVLTCDKSDYLLAEKMNDLAFCKWWVPKSLLIVLQHLIPS